MKQDISFFDQNGKKLQLTAAKNSKFKVYNVTYIKGSAYFNVEKGCWVPSYATKGAVSFYRNNDLYIINGGHQSIQTPTNTLILKRKAYIYNARGVRENGMYIKKGAKIKSQGYLKINGHGFYNLGNGRYIKAGNVANNTQAAQTNQASTKNSQENSIPGRPKNWQAGKDTIKLAKNAYPYDAAGKRKTNLSYSVINKNTVLNFYGMKTINGQTYYDIGNGVYVKAANVGTVNTKINN